MKSIFFRLLFILLALINFIELYAQVKKPGVKSVAAVKATTPVKANTAAVVKPKLPVQNKAVAAKKVVKPVKAKAASTLTFRVPNKPVNNSEITNVSLTNREQEMINEINNLRSNPATYCTYAESYLQKRYNNE